MSTPAFAIRPAMPEDVPAILGLIQEHAAYEGMSDAVEATEDALARHVFGESPTAEVLIAEYAGQTVGYALFFTNFSAFLARPGIYLEDMFVRPERRGLGIGKALLRRLACIVGERHGRRLEWSVLKGNALAIDFYRSLEAEEMADLSVYRLAGAPLSQLAASRES
jgi:GNAT superfamily N-acetyltransferase